MSSYKYNQLFISPISHLCLSPPFQCLSAFLKIFCLNVRSNWNIFEKHIKTVEPDVNSSTEVWHSHEQLWHHSAHQQYQLPQDATLMIGIVKCSSPVVKWHPNLRDAKCEKKCVGIAQMWKLYFTELWLSKLADNLWPYLWPLLWYLTSI